LAITDVDWWPNVTDVLMLIPSFTCTDPSRRLSFVYLALIRHARPVWD